MTVSCRLVFLVVVLVSGCSKTANPEVCCTDPMDCASIGAGEDNRPCPTALSCVDHECVIPECSTQGCPVALPVCNPASNVCEECATNADCANFNSEPHCSEMGACVQCVTSKDCGPTVPVCSGSTCRRCELDSECATGACAGDGTCVAESAIAYVSPLGSDTAECTQAAPCRTIPRAVSKTTSTRNHVVLENATYAASMAITIFPGITSAESLTLHGNGASLVGSSGDPTIVSTIPIHVRDLTLQQQTGASAIRIRNTMGLSTFERVTVSASNRGIELESPAVLRDVKVNGSAAGDFSAGISIETGLVEMDRVTVHGFGSCIAGVTTLQLTARNVLAYDCSVLAADIPSAAGVVESSTFVVRGPAATGPRAIRCAIGLTVKSSIVWAPGATLAVQNCVFTKSIVGPTAIAGTSNADPLFVDLVAGDFHLKAGSPAKDAADSGPALDVVNNPRPQGLRYDIGAYEQ